MNTHGNITDSTRNALPRNQGTGGSANESGRRGLDVNLRNIFQALATLDTDMNVLMVRMQQNESRTAETIRRLNEMETEMADVQTDVNRLTADVQADTADLAQIKGLVQSDNQAIQQLRQQLAAVQPGVAASAFDLTAFEQALDQLEANNAAKQQILSADQSNNTGGNGGTTAQASGTQQAASGAGGNTLATGNPPTVGASTGDSPSGQAVTPGTTNSAGA